MHALKELEPRRRARIRMLGRKFGRLTVLARSLKVRQFKGACWECRCECGSIVEVQGCDLRRGKTRSCGCLMRELARLRPLIDMTGQTFNRLKVLRRADCIRPGEAKWLCHCSCGEFRFATGTQLRSGQSQSCGCLVREMTSKRCTLALTGQRFGRLIAMQRVPNIGRRVRWLCLCDCGEKTEVDAGQLRRGRTRSCGCLAREQTSQRCTSDLTGQRFGSLIVQQRAVSNGERVRWRCLCACGETVDVEARRLRSGSRRSCGCQK